MRSMLWKSGESWKIVFLVLSLPEQGMDLPTIRALGHIPSPHPSLEIKQAVTKRGNLWALNNSRDFHALLLFFLLLSLGRIHPLPHTGAWERGSLSWDTQTLHIFLSSLLPPGHLSLCINICLPSQPFPYFVFLALHTHLSLPVPLSSLPQEHSISIGDGTWEFGFNIS